MRTSNHMSYKINNFCKTFAHFYHKLNKMGALNTSFCPIFHTATDKEAHKKTNALPPNWQRAPTYRYGTDIA